MAQTYTFSVDASGNDEQVVIQSASGATRVVVYENNQAGTADYLIRMPTSTSPQVTRPAGSKTEFFSAKDERFYSGQTVAFISTASGTLTFIQEEY